MGFYGLYLASWLALGLSQGLKLPFVLGIAAALAQALWHFTLIRGRTRDGCFRAFRANHWLGFAVFAGVAADFLLR
jgi:4-hydroxybenzoate polyprenyltransferase